MLKATVGKMEKRADSPPLPLRCTHALPPSPSSLPQLRCCRDFKRQSNRYVTELTVPVAEVYSNNFPSKIKTNINQAGVITCQAETLPTRNQF